MVPLLVAGVLLIATSISGCSLVQKTPSNDANSIVAKVGTQEIKKSDFDKVFGPVKAGYEQKYGIEIWETVQDGKKIIDLVKEKTLDTMIDDMLQLKKAGDMGLVVTDDEVNAEIEKFEKYFDSKEKFQEFLTTQKMDLEYFKNQIKIEMIKGKLREKLTEGVSVTDTELAEYYMNHQGEFFSVKASHILLTTEEEAKKVLERVKAGEDFSKLAKELSIDPSAKTNSGNLDYFKQGDMLPEFEQAAFALKPGQISDIVKTSYGFHIIKVEDRKTDRLEDVAEELQIKLINSKKDSEYSKVIEEIKKNTEIKKEIKNL